MSFLAAAIALAGFAGIVTSIDRRTVGASSEVITFRVRTLVIAAVLSVLLAMLPILVEALEIATATLWQFVSVIGAAGTAAISIYVVLLRRRMAGVDQGLSRPTFFTGLVLGIVVTVSEILGAGGWLPGRGAYFLGLAFLQFQMCMLFYRMVRMADDAARLAPRRHRLNRQPLARGALSYSRRLAATDLEALVADSLSGGARYAKR